MHSSSVNGSVHSLRAQSSQVQLHCSTTLSSDLFLSLYLLADFIFVWTNRWGIHRTLHLPPGRHFLRQRTAIVKPGDLFHGKPSFRACVATMTQPTENAVQPERLLQPIQHAYQAALQLLENTWKDTIQRMALLADALQVWRTH